MVGGQGGPVDRSSASFDQALLLSWFVSQNLFMFLAKRSKEDLTLMHDLMETGKVTPVIDKCYRLSEVPEAIRYLEEGTLEEK
jgi:D-arabinose 1-dehydrogenase-like Zn-dependent alcohol dehydrogenase